MSWPHILYRRVYECKKEVGSQCWHQENCDWSGSVVSKFKHFCTVIPVRWLLFESKLCKVRTLKWPNYCLLDTSVIGFLWVWKIIGISSACKWKLPNNVLPAGMFDGRNSLDEFQQTTEMASNASVFWSIGCYPTASPDIMSSFPFSIWLHCSHWFGHPTRTEQELRSRWLHRRTCTRRTTPPEEERKQQIDIRLSSATQTATEIRNPSKWFTLRD